MKTVADFIGWCVANPYMHWSDVQQGPLSDDLYIWRCALEDNTVLQFPATGIRMLNNYKQLCGLVGKEDADHALQQYFDDNQ